MTIFGTSKLKSLPATIFVAAAALCSCTTAWAGSNKSEIITVEEIAKKLVVNKNKDQNIWTVSSFKIMMPLPKKKAAAEQIEARSNSEAWLLARFDRNAGTIDITVHWQQYISSDKTNAFKTSIVKLPGYPQQAGPDMHVEHATDCTDGYQQSDPYTVYTYQRGCSERWNYTLPITTEVLRFLAQRTETDPNTPMAITFEGTGTDKKTMSSLFHFYPAEAKALIIELEKLQASAKLKSAVP